MLTPGSIILCILIIYVIFRRDKFISKYMDLLLLCIIIEILMPRGFFLLIGTSEVSYDTFMACFMIIVSLLMLTKKGVKIPKKIFFLGCMFLIVSLIGIIHQAIEPIDGLIMNYNSTGSWDAYAIGIQNKGLVDISWTRALVTYVHLINVVLIVFIFKVVVGKNEILYMLRNINIFLKYNIFIVITEFFLKNVFHSNIIGDIVKLLLGDGANTYTDLIIRNGIYQLQGISREPSHLALTIYFTIILYIQEKYLLHSNLKLKDYLYVMIGIILGYISGSFASLLYTTIIIVWFMYLYSLKRQIFKVVAIVFFPMVVASITYALLYGYVDSSSYIGRRLNMATMMLGAVTDGSWYGLGGDSALARFISIVDTFNDFCKRPWFGLGLSVEQSHGGLANVLADVGIVGFFIWCILVFSKYKYQHSSLVIILILSNVLISLGNNCLGMISIIFVVACFRRVSEYTRGESC